MNLDIALIFIRDFKKIQANATSTSENNDNFLGRDPLK